MRDKEVEDNNPKKKKNITLLYSILNKLGITSLSVLLNVWLHLQAAVVFLALGLLY